MWTADAVEELLVQAAEVKSSMGLLTGRRKKEDLLKVARLVPLQVMPLFDEAQKAMAAVVEVDDEWIYNSQGKPLMCMLEDLANEVAAFWKEQAGKSEASERK